MRGFFLFAAAVLLVGLLPVRTGAFPCPSYPFGSDPNKCNADGFCGWFDMRAFLNDNGDTQTDDPGPTFATFADPWADTTNATVGGGTGYGIADSDLDTDRGVVAAGGSARFEGPCCESPPSVTAEGRAFALMRVADLVFTGPDVEVETSLRVVFDGHFEEIATNVQDGAAKSTVQSRKSVYLGGGICNGSEYLSFQGSHVRLILDNSDGENLLNEYGSGIIQQVPLEGKTEFEVGPFTVPTSEPLTFELWIETLVLASGNGGFARATADFSLALGPPGGGEVFVLPPGYTANSPTAAIVSNTVPEPGADLAGLAAVGTLAALRRQRATDPSSRREMA